MSGRDRAAGSAEPAKAGAEALPASRLIDQRIRDLGGWRGETLARMRALILEACPEVVEEWKWRGTPVWSRHGIVCTGESYKKIVKLTFARGASLPDPAHLFNASLEGSTRRAIDIREGETVEAGAFRALVKAAVARNATRAGARGAGSAGTASDAAGGESPPSQEGGPVTRPKLLAGGNPQIAKAEGDAPVQAYIAAMPGWKRDVGVRIDAIVERTVPAVRKAVKWNTPLYGVEDRGWFLGFHCFNRYVKITFFRGASLDPLPPGRSKHAEVRYLDIHEADPIDEAQLTRWIEQASGLPGEHL